MTLELIAYENNSSTKDDSESTAVYRCTWDEWEDERDGLLGAIDPFDSTLVCQTVRCVSKGSDDYERHAELTCHSVSPERADLEGGTVDAAMKWRLGYSAECFTISGKGWTWASELPINNQNILPVKTVSTTEVILYGVRSTIDLSTFDIYSGKVNTDPFLGAAAETVLFIGASATPRKGRGGVTVYDVEVKLMRRSESWNKFFNEDADTADWEEIVDGASNPVYGDVDFSGLLAAPT